MNIPLGLVACIKQIFLPKQIARYFFIAAVPALLFYFISILILRSSGFEIMEILRDPAQLSGKSSFLGFLSNAGIWIWVSSAAICIFSGFNFHGTAADGKLKELLFLTGALSLLLAIDDFYMIHDRYVNQKICYLAYAVLAGALLVRHYSKIIEINGFSFLLAGSLLALSILTDLIQSHIPLSYSSTQILEEGFKFVGASTWFYFSCCISSIRPKTEGSFKN